MATLTTAPVAAQIPPLTTPQILWRALAGIWILDVLFLLALLAGSRIHRAGIQTVGKDAAPSIIAAQHIKAALADMDANAANELLGEPGQIPAAAKAYEARRQEAAAALITAAGNITYGDAERDPILRMQIGLGTYEARIQQARDLHQERSGKLIAAYGTAADLLDHEVLPATDALDDANLEVLDRTYQSQHGRSVASRGFIAAVAVALLAFLLFVQKFLANRTRRLINIPLLLATCMTACCAYYTLHVLATEQQDLKVAREDAFASIHVLWRARAMAYAANADERRYLLDSANAAKHEQDFLAKQDALIKLPPGETFQSLTRGLGSNVDGFTGYLADELKNITFEGERTAAIQTLRAFGEYLQADQQIRTLERGGHHQEAVTFCLGTKQGESNWAFEQFDKALGETLAINQAAFDRVVNSGFAALAHFDVKMSICAVIVGVLTLLGLMQRIREYR